MKTMPAGPYPVEVSLCIDEQDWERTTRRKWQSVGGARAVWPQGCRGAVEAFPFQDGSLWLVVVFREGLLAHPEWERIGVIAHEATHLWQYVREHCGVRQIDHEVEAHAVEWFTAWIAKQLHSEGWL